MANLTNGQRVQILSDTIELADIAAARDIDTSVFIVKHTANALGLKLSDAHKFLTTETNAKLEALMADAGL